MEPSIGLLLLQLQSEHSQLYDQDERIDALAPSALQDVLVPRVLTIAIRGQVVRYKGDAQCYIGQAVENS